MDEKQLQELYNSMISKDPSYKDYMPFESFKQKMADKAYYDKVLSFVGAEPKKTDASKITGELTQPDSNQRKQSAAQKNKIEAPKTTAISKADKMEVSDTDIDPGGLVFNTMAGLNRGFYKNIIGNPIKAMGTLLGSTTTKITGGKDKGFISDALVRFGDYFNNTIDELAYMDEEFKGSLMDQFSQAFGQVASLVLTYGVSSAGGAAQGGSSLAKASSASASKIPPSISAAKNLASELASPSAISAGLSMGQAEFDRAKELGATDDQAFEAFWKNAAVGSVLEKVPVMQFFKRFNKASSGGISNYLKTKGVAGVTGGIEEMTTEVLQQIYSNATAKDIYNVNQRLFEGVAESGGVGFGVGFLLNAMGANAKILRNQGKEEDANVIEAQIKELETQAQRGGPSSYTFNGIKIQPMQTEEGIRDPREVVSEMIDNMTAADLAKANIEITNDPELKIKLQEKIVTSSIKEQAREANPNLSDEQLDEITNLEKELRKLEGNTTQIGKDKAAEIRSQIKDIQQNAIQEQSADAGVLRGEGPKVGLQEVVQGDQEPQVATGGTQAQVTAQQPPVQITGLSISDPEVDTRITDEKQKGVLSFAKKAVNAINSIMPGVEFVVHDNSDSYAAAVSQRTGKESKEFSGTSGYFTYGTDGSVRIDLDLSRANNRTVAHEVTHAVLYKKFNEDFTLYKDFRDRLSGVISSMVPQDFVEEGNVDEDNKKTTVKEQLEDFVSRYKDQGDDVQAEEFITELSAMLANNEAKISTSGWNKISSFIGDFVSKITGGKINLFEGARTTRDVVDFFNSMSKSIAAGEDLSAVNFARRGGQAPATGQVTQGGKASISDENKYKPLPGAPTKAKDIAGPDPKLVSVAEQYAKENGIDFKRQGEYVEIDEAFSKRIAQAFEDMKHDPSNEKVKEAYSDLIRQTKDQYDALIKAGYEFSFFDSKTDPYKGNPSDAMRDLRSNKKMAVYGTYDGYGTEGITAKEQAENPLLEDTGLRWKDQNGVEKPVTANDLFRAVHDAFGHGLEGAGFRARGEENAWQAHVRLFQGPAVGAITTETRGQNSWLNFGPYGEKNRTAKLEDTVFGEQKIGLMPEWTWTERRAPDYQAQAEIKPEVKGKASVLSDYRDNKRFKFSDLKYPDTVLGKVKEGKDINTAISFYEKIVRVFNKLFDRNVKVYSKKNKNNFGVTVEYETGLKPKYFSYPTSKMGEHVVVDKIDKFTPLTSLRHELIHEMLVKNITDKFERINEMDQSAVSESIENVQRNRAYNYSLEDVFFERVVENIERLPDNKDTFPIETYAQDVVNRLVSELNNESPSKEEVDAKLNELLEGSNPWLKKNLTDAIGKADFSRPLKESIDKIGKYFSDRFTVSKDIFPKDLQEKIFKFTEIFNDEYQGVLTRLKSTEKTKPAVKGKASRMAVEETAKALEEAAPDYSYSFGKNRQQRYYVYKTAGLVYHGGSSKIKSFDASKIKGGARGELGYGFYFGQSSKPLDYGSEVTFLDSNNLNLIDADKPSTDPNFLSKLEGYANSISDVDNKISKLEDLLSKSKNNTDYIKILGQIISLQTKQITLIKNTNAINYAKELLSSIKENPRESIRYLAVRGSERQNVLFSEIMKGIGYDGMQVSDNWQLVVYPSDNIDQLIVDPNKFSAEAYHKAKEDGSNPKLVNAVDKLIGTKPEVKGKASMMAVEETAKALEEAGLNNVLKGALKGYSGYIHQTTKESYDSIIKNGWNKNVNNIWLSPDDTSSYGDYEMEVYIKINNPLVLDKQYEDKNGKKTDTYDISKNRKLYESLGGEANSNSFSELRDMGYDSIIEENGDVASLYPEDAIFSDSPISVAEAYHKAKSNGTSPELVKAVEDAIGANPEIKGKASRLAPENEVSEKTLPGYDSLVAGIAKYVSNAISRGDAKADIVRTAVDIAQSSPIYESANDVQREQIVREARKAAGASQKSSPSVSRLFGIKPKDVTMTELQALNKQISDLARGARDAKNDINERRKNLSDAVRKLAASGNVSAKKVSAIINKISNLNLYSANKVNDFIQYATNVFADADYAEKLNSANATRKQIKKLSKSADKFANLRDLGSRFSEIDPSLVDDIDEYNKIASLVKESIKGSTTRGAEARFATIASEEQVNKYISDAMATQDQKMLDAKIEEAQDLLGFDATGMTYDEILELLESPKSIAKDIENMIRAGINKAFDIYKTIIKDIIDTGVDSFTGAPVNYTDNQKRIIQQFIDIDPGKLNVKQALEAVDALVNFVTNGSIAKMESVVEKYNGKENMIKSEQKGIKGRVVKKYGSKSFGRLLVEQTANLNILFERVFGGFNRAGFMENMIGITDIKNGVSKARSEANAVVKQYVEIFYGKKANGQAFNTAYNNIERGMVAFLSRSVFGSKKEIDQEFQRRKDLILKIDKDGKRTGSIAELERGNEQEVKKAKIYQEVFDKIARDSKNYQEVTSKADRVNVDAVDFWKQKWDERYQRLSDVALGIYNKVLGRDTNYSPDRFTRLSYDTGDFDISSDDMSFIFNSGNAGIYKKETGVLMTATRPESLPTNTKTGEANRYVDLSFDNNNSNSIYDALVDINTAGAIRRSESAMNSSAFRRIVESADDRKMIEGRVRLYVNNARKKNPFSDDEFSKAAKKLNRLATIGVGQALGGVLQPVKQVIPIAMNTLINAGGLNLSSISNKSVQDFINKSGYAIANRGIESQAQIESLDKMIEDAASSKAGKAIDKIESINKWWLKNLLVRFDVGIARASWITYYEQHLKKNGIDPSTIDYSTHEINEEAADYAQRQVDRQQNVSDSDLSGAILSSKDASKQLFTKIMMPFASFRMNQSARLGSDISTLLNSTSTKEDKVVAARSLAGFMAEMATFRALSYGSALVIGSVVAGMMGKDDDEEEEKKKRDARIKGQLTNTVADMFSPAPILDRLVQLGVSKTLESVQDAYEVEKEDRIEIYSGDKQTMFQSLGLLGITAERADQLWEMSKLYKEGTFKDNYGNEKELLESDREVIGKMIPVAIMSGIGLAPTEFNSVVRGVVKEAKRGADRVSQAKQEDYKPETPRERRERILKEKRERINKRRASR